MNITHQQLWTDPDDLPFRHYTLKHRAVSWISQTLFDKVTYTQRHGLIAGMRRRGGLGWLPVRPEVTHEQRFWSSLDLKGQVVYDVGAFHGMLTLFFATQAKEVISYEPASRNYARLVENLRLNNITNVKPRKVGLGSTRRSASLCFAPLTPGGASVEPRAAQGIRRSSHHCEEIAITTLDTDIRKNQLPTPDFIKIDTEGLESEALLGAAETLARARPSLFLEMHGESLNEKRRKCSEIIAILQDLGYRDVFHVETSSQVTPANAAVAIEGHLYCPSSARSGVKCRHALSGHLAS